MDSKKAEFAIYRIEIDTIKELGMIMRKHLEGDVEKQNV